MPSLDKILAGLSLPLDLMRQALVELAERNPELAPAAAVAIEQIDALLSAADLKQRALNEAMDLIAAIQSGHGEIDADDPHTDA